MEGMIIREEFREVFRIIKSFATGSDLFPVVMEYQVFRPAWKYKHDQLAEASRCLVDCWGDGGEAVHVRLKQL